MLIKVTFIGPAIGPLGTLLKLPQLILQQAYKVGAILIPIL